MGLKAILKRGDKPSMRTLIIAATLVGFGLSLTSCTPQDCAKYPELQACQDTGADPDDNGRDPAGEDDPIQDDDTIQPDPDPDQDGDDQSDDGDSTGSFDWQLNADFIAQIVDDNNNNDELSLVRRKESFSRGDECHEPLENNQRFADAIGYFLDELSEGRKIQLQGIASFYGMSSNDSTYFPVGLMTHPLCRVTRSTLSNTVRNVPDNNTIALAQRFADDHNRFRAQAQNGSDQGKEDFKKLWGKFFGCLAYTESLSTADTAPSQRVADRLSPSGYRKPAGVKFYDDPQQSQASRYNIGLFQFTPTYGGNINPCFKQWNRDYPSCSIGNSGRDEMVRVVGSSLQHFNAYCGIHKVVQTFSVQVNSNKSRNTHPDNRQGSGLKPSDQRCVTPHFYAGWAYNHFGPLQNSTGSNLNKLLRCVYAQ